MDDPRMRLLATIALTAAAYTSVAAALLTLLWWAIFCPWKTLVARRYAAAVLFFTIALVAVVVQLTTGGGTSYFVRMGAIATIALWASAAWQPGDLLGTAVWAFGARGGFVIGMIGEMAVIRIAALEEEFKRVSLAFSLKGQKISPANLIPLCYLVLQRALIGAGDQADLLALRGFSGKGVICPCFRQGRTDGIALGLALCIVLAGVLSFERYL